MTENGTNPYSPPNPIEPHNLAALEVHAGRGRIGTALWWLYFVVSMLFFGVGLIGFAAILARNGDWHYAISPLGFINLVQAFGLAGLLLYLLRVPLLHPFFWGLVFLARLGLTIYSPIRAFSYQLGREESLFTIWQIAILAVIFCLSLPEVYALWRYSSSSSSIWKAPRISWKRQAQCLIQAVLKLRRA